MSTARNLYQLQEVENTIATLEKERQQIEKNLSFNQKLNDAQTNLEEKQSQHTETRKKLREIELDLSGLSQKVEASEKELYSGKITSPKELANLQLDIDNINKQRRQHEEQTLVLMEETEQLNRQSAEYQQLIETLAAEWEQEKVTLNKKLEALDKNLATQQKNKLHLLSLIPKETAERYYRVKNQKGTAVVMVEQGVCHGCRISLPARTIRQAKSNRVVQCSSCGRLIYMP